MAAQAARRFRLHVSEWVRGFGPARDEQWAPADVNLCLVFQVNCPGCFMHSLPSLNALAQQFGAATTLNKCPPPSAADAAGAARSLNLFAVATAFEDFELNTLENLRALVREKKVVGETARMLRARGQRELPYELGFPVGFDVVAPRKMDDKSLVDEAAEALKRMQEADPDLEERIARIPKRIIIQELVQSLQQRPFRAATFEENMLNGTPSWALFDREGRLLASWIGHRENEWVARLVAAALADKALPGDDA